MKNPVPIQPDIEIEYETVEAIENWCVRWRDGEVEWGRDELPDGFSLAAGDKVWFTSRVIEDPVALRVNQ